MKLLIDLRSINYGRSGGIENYAYYVIDCLKITDIDITIDVSPYSKVYFEKKYSQNKNITVVCDPFLEKLNNIIQRIFPDKYRMLGRRKGWAKKALADFVYSPNHMDKYQHLHLSGIITMHAYLPEYDNKIKNIIKYNADIATALITSWNYPYQEFISKFPQHKNKWYLIPYIAAHNINKDNQTPIKDLPKDYFLYVAFFSERKNQMRLVEAYAIALKENARLPILVLAGGVDSDYKMKVVELIKKLNLDNNIYIFKYLPEEKISYLYHNCYAVISPTLWEAASGAVLEATYCGKPVICSNVEPLSDFANYFKLKMMFFDPLNANDISEKIIKFYDNYEALKQDALKNKEQLIKYDKNYFSNEFLKLLGQH